MSSDPIPSALRIIQAPGLHQVLEPGLYRPPIFRKAVQQNIISVIYQARVLAEDDRIVIRSERQDTRRGGEGLVVLADLEIEVRRAQEKGRRPRGEGQHLAEALARLSLLSGIEKRLPEVGPSIGILRVSLENLAE
jgi:hypothetical protein